MIDRHTEGGVSPCRWAGGRELPGSGAGSVTRTAGSWWKQGRFSGSGTRLPLHLARQKLHNRRCTCPLYFFCGRHLGRSRPAFPFPWAKPGALPSSGPSAGLSQILLPSKAWVLSVVLGWARLPTPPQRLRELTLFVRRRRQHGIGGRELFLVCSLTCRGSTNRRV